MEPYDRAGREHWCQTGFLGPYDSRRVSDVSALSDGSVYHENGSRVSDWRARASLVSLQSTHEGSTFMETEATGGRFVNDPASWWPASLGYRVGEAGGYAPVSNTFAAPPARTPSGSVLRRPSYASVARRNIPESIREEEYDLSLLQAPVPMGAAPWYEAVQAHDEIAAPVVSSDITSSSDLTGPYGFEFQRDLRHQVARRISNGGLASPSLARSSPRYGTSTELRVHQRQKIRHKSRHEAKRRGGVFEVIFETEPTDLSSFDGSSMVEGAESRRGMSASEVQKPDVLYPQPNWKPWAMRWPYLVAMIILSLALSAMQEILFRKFENAPLLQFRKPADVTAGLYLAVKFAPTLSAVVYGILWQFVDFEVRRLEAYHKLSKPGGALAAESINVDYVTSFNFYRPFRAFKLGHYAVALSSIATTLAISFVPTFAAASLVLTPSRAERMKQPDGDKFIHFSPAWSRLLTATLAVCAACGVGLLFLLQTRRSGLLSDVRGIAGLASMAVVSHILMDFKDMDTAKHKDIHQKLKHNRYMLRNSSLAPDDENPATSQEKTKFKDAWLPENPHPLMLRPAGFVPFIVVLLGFTGFVPAFLFTRADVLAEKAPWVVTTVAVCLKMSWGALETAVRMMEPYYILSRRHAPPFVLTLDYTTMPFGYLALQAFLNGHAVMFLVGFGSVLAEFLTILVTGLATVDGKNFLLLGGGQGTAEDEQSSTGPINAGQETALSFYMSFGVVVLVLTYMSVVSCLIYLRRRHPFLPRQPNTIASVLAFIHQSKMLHDFVVTDDAVGHHDGRRSLRNAAGCTYGLGWFLGRDGQMHCGVDREELASSYTHGVDCRLRNQPWNMQWDVL